MYRNRYDGLLEQWKLNLIADRVRRMGFRGQDADEVQQLAVLELISFKFDPDRPDGGSEATATVAVIDRRLLMVRRSQSRYASRLEQIRAERGGNDTTESHSPAMDQTPPAPLITDVRAAIAALDALDRQVCQALAEGRSVDEIARFLGCGWHTVARRISRIREHFMKIGLDGWVCD